MQTNAADKGQVKRAALDERLDQKQLLDDVKTVLALQAGRRFVWWIMGLGKLFETTFTGNSQGMFYEGMRNLALTIWSKVIESDPEMIFKMMRESQKREESKNG